MNILLLTIFALVFQIILSNYFVYGGFGINILLLLTVEVALIKGSYEGTATGFITGLVEDILEMGILGANSFVRVFVGFMVGFIKNKFDVGNVIFQVMITFLVFVIHGLSIYVIKAIFNYPLPLIKSIIINACINSILAPFIYLLVRKTIAR